MKHILVVGDGMSDRPLSELGGKTPLEAASTPNMDRMASNGTAGTFQTIKEGYGAGTDYAHFSIFGIDAHRHYTGRAPIEAGAMGIPLREKDIAIRTNLVFLKDGKMEDYSAGHITTEEAAGLIASLNENLGKKGEVEFHHGVSYRHILVLRKNYSDAIKTTPPHDIAGNPFQNYLPSPKNKEGEKTAKLLNSFITSSWEIFKSHPVNEKRASENHPPANSVWFWGQGKRPSLQTLKARFKKTGAIITAVDILKGFAKLMGMDSISVKGATGYFDTNYEGKAAAAINALKTHDFALVHIEAPDEAGHIGDIKEKIRAIENIDSKIIGPIISALEKSKTPFTIAVLSDHGTPISVKSHVSDPVPFALWRSDEKKARKIKFGENCKDIHLEDGFIELFFK